MRALALPLLLLGACAAGPDVDGANNPYPIACQADLSGLPVTILEVPRDRLEAVARSSGVRLQEGRILRGLYIKGSTIIMIDQALQGWVREDAIRHEKCHYLTGDWHR